MIDALSDYCTRQQCRQYMCHYIQIDIVSNTPRWKINATLLPPVELNMYQCTPTLSTITVATGQLIPATNNCGVAPVLGVHNLDFRFTHGGVLTNRKH